MDRQIRPEMLWGAKVGTIAMPVVIQELRRLGLEAAKLSSNHDAALA